MAGYRRCVRIYLSTVVLAMLSDPVTLSGPLIAARACRDMAELPAAPLTGLLLASRQELSAHGWLRFSAARHNLFY